MILAIAPRALAANETIWQEHAFLLVVSLLDRARINVTTVMQRRVNTAHQFFILRRMCGVVVIEIDAEIVEVLDEFRGKFLG